MTKDKLIETVKDLKKSLLSFRLSKMTEEGAKQASKVRFIRKNVAVALTLLVAMKEKKD